FSLVHVRVVLRPWIIEKLLRCFSHLTSETSIPKNLQRSSHKEHEKALSIKGNLSNKPAERARQLVDMALHFVNAAYYLEEPDRKDKLKEAGEAFYEAAQNFDISVPWKSCEYRVQGFLCLLQSESDRVFEVVETINSKILNVAGQYTQQGKSRSPFSFHPSFLKLRHHVGWFYLECAQAATTLEEQIEWLDKAYKDFLEMYDNTIHYGEMLSESLLRFLQERCLILKRVYKELGGQRNKSKSLVDMLHKINNLLEQVLGDQVII
ncbi:MAG: hypothetical protein ACYSW0_16365, partial [Planctomycetota bacterium]